MKTNSFIYFILILTMASCVSQNNELINTMWVYDYGDGCQDYIEFKNKNKYEFNSCETGETLFGTYSLNGDSLILHQVRGAYDQEFTEGLRHLTPEVKFKLSIENDSISFKERWEVDPKGNWVKSDFNFPNGYRFSRQ